MKRQLDPWNHNIHYFDVLVAEAPPACLSALDVGCGEGRLAGRLQALVPHVVGIDVDEASISSARQRDKENTIDFVAGDFLTYRFQDQSFDFITCSAALHHMPLERALLRMTDLLRPGGVLAILGLARSRYPVDLARDVPAVVANRLYLMKHPRSESVAPAVWPAAHTYGEIQSVGERLLPGHRFHRHLLWRYSLIWTRPATAG